MDRNIPVRAAPHADPIERYTLVAAQSHILIIGKSGESHSISKIIGGKFILKKFTVTSSDVARFHLAMEDCGAKSGEIIATDINETTKALARSYGIEVSTIEKWQQYTMLRDGFTVESAPTGMFIVGKSGEKYWASRVEGDTVVRVLRMAAKSTDIECLKMAVADTGMNWRIVASAASMDAMRLATRYGLKLVLLSDLQRNSIQYDPNKRLQSK
jgi:hypothetical protein